MPQSERSTRREFLVAAAALGALATSGATAARPAAAADAGGNRVDVHHHYFPPAMIEAQDAARGEGISPGVRAWTPARTLEAMDGGGVATAIVSTSSNAALRKSQGRDGMLRLARTCNDYAARMAADHAGRFGVHTFLPLPDIDGSLKELEYALDQLKADSVGLMTSYDDKWLGDEHFLPLLQELDRRKATVFVHPLAPNCCGNLVPGIAASTVEYPYDTGRAVLSLLTNGRFARYRAINWIFCHAGGPIPVLAGRINNSLRHDKALPQYAPNGIDYELKRLHYETANSTSAPAMAALMAYVPAAQILFGSDFPYVSVADNVAGLARISMPADERAAIERGNAAKLFPRLRAPT